MDRPFVSAPTPGPFDLLDAVGCANCRVADTLEVVADMLHDAAVGGIDQAHMSRHLYAAWNVLELAREHFAGADAKLHAAEDALLIGRHVRAAA